MIVDCHTHWGRAWRDRDGDDPSNFLAMLDKHGVDAAFLMPEAGIMRADWCVSDNDAVLKVCSAARDRLMPFVTSWPQLGDEALPEIVRCVELGAKGLKFHPWLQSFSVADPVFSEICKLAGELHVPVVFHDGTPPYALPEQIAGLALRFPQTTFVLGHSGIVWNWRSAVDAARLPNVWACMCGPHLRATEIMCAEISPDRLLWGSDAGFGLADPIGYWLGLIKTAKLDRRILEDMLGSNPMRFIGTQDAAWRESN